MLSRFSSRRSLPGFDTPYGEAPRREVSHRKRGMPGCFSGPAYDGSMVKVVGKISPTEVREIRAEGEDYEAARDALHAQVPEGWRLTSIMTER